MDCIDLDPLVGVGLFSAILQAIFPEKGEGIAQEFSLLSPPGGDDIRSRSDFILTNHFETIKSLY